MTAPTATTISVSNEAERADMARAELAAHPVWSDLRDYYAEVANAAVRTLNLSLAVMDAQQRAEYHAYRAAR